MRVANDSGRAMSNGDLGMITGLDMEEGTPTVLFESQSVVHGFGKLEKLLMAHATTIRTTRDSEYPAMVIPLTTRRYPMLARSRLYTEATWGKRLVVLVGQRRAPVVAAGPTMPEAGGA